MVSVASQLIEEVTAHAQSDGLEDEWEICVDGTYFPNNLRMVDIIHDEAGSWLCTKIHLIRRGIKQPE